MMRVVAFVMVVVLAACAAPVQHNTPSGRPEVTIPGGSVSEVRGYLINAMIDTGYQLADDQPSQLVFERNVDNLLGAMFFGSQYDATPAARISYTIADTGTAVRVVANFAIVTNDGSAFERVTAVNNNADTLQYQDMLFAMRDSLTGRQGSGEGVVSVK